MRPPRRRGGSAAQFVQALQHGDQIGIDAAAGFVPGFARAQRRHARRFAAAQLRQQAIQARVIGHGEAVAGHRPAPTRVFAQAQQRIARIAFDLVAGAQARRRLAPAPVPARRR
ncbi:hypothetical protein FE772_24040 [Lysobacter enzymogenes]|nr:hypothetical protein [Lysobacter enzymogenes]QCW28261.1 hypothetical protein FE772_24040 [Lysobacter enzymogenes]